MIIILLILATFVFAGAMIFAHSGTGRMVTVVLSFIVIAGSLLALVGNDNYHWGMQRVTTTQIQDLTPAKSKQAAVLVKQLGTGSERTVIYRVKGTTKLAHTVADATTTTKFVNGQPAQVQLATTRWAYRNHLTKVLFKLGTGPAQVTHRQYLFTVPTNWKTVTIPTK